MRRALWLAKVKRENNSELYWALGLFLAQSHASFQLKARFLKRKIMGSVKTTSSPTKRGKYGKRQTVEI
jgi:hypothetical protein